MRSSRKAIRADEFDRAFEEGKDMTPYLELRFAKGRHPTRRINVDVPRDLLKKVDQEAARIGVPRTSLIKIWISERLDQMGAAA